MALSDDVTECGTEQTDQTWREAEVAIEYWKWKDSELPEYEARQWRETRDRFRPLDEAAPVEEHGPICSECGREAKVLFFDPRLKTEAEMREAAQGLIRMVRERIDKNPRNRCGDHDYRSALTP